MDYDALGLIPLTTPVETHTDLEGQRARAERAPVAPPPSREAPSAAEAAAQAAIERLQSMLDEPSSAAPPATTAAQSEAQPDPVSAGPAEPAVFVPTGLTVGKPRRWWLGPFAILVLGAVGVGLLALAAIWGFQPETEQVLGVSPRVAGVTIGLVGAAALGVATYFVLERLGMPRDRA
jgi:hypothetical protein